MKRLVYGLLLFSFVIMMAVAGQNLLTPPVAAAARDTIGLPLPNRIEAHIPAVAQATPSPAGIGASLTPTPIPPSRTPTCCTPTSAPPTVTPTGTLPAPIIVVSPTGIVETHANPPQQTYTNFTIGNSGNATLDWDLLKAGKGSAMVQEGPCAIPEDVPWLTVSPTNGTNNPGVSRPVELNFTSASLPNGVYQATVCIISNDFTQPFIEFPVTLNVGAPSAVLLAEIENPGMSMNQLYIIGVGLLLLVAMMTRRFRK